jgi:DNA-binding MarR family transcriptional regulator
MQVADTQVVEALERLVAAAVGLTTTVLGEVSVAGELTLPQWRILVVVTRSDGSRVGEVAGKVGVSLPAASRLVRRLERRGLVTAARDEDDRRATIVRPTEKGLRLWEDVVGRRRRRLVAALDVLEEPLPTGFGRGLELVAGTLERGG